MANPGTLPIYQVSPHSPTRSTVGTVIRGKPTPTNPGEASSLFVVRGGKIFAEGTPTPPIIFGKSGQTLQMVVATEVGKTYQLQSTTDLGATPIVWTNEGAADEGDGATESFDQTIGASGDTYFQIKVD